MASSFRSIVTAAVGLCGAIAFQSLPAQAQVYRGVPINQGGYIRYAPGPLVGGGGAGFRGPIGGAGFRGPVGVAPRGFGVRPGGFAPRYGGIPYYRPVAGGYRGPVYGPGWRGGYYGRPYVAPRYYGGYYPYRRYYGGYYPYRRYWGGYYPYRYGWGGYYGDGGIVAAGLIGGLTLGALAASQPYYYPNYYYPGAYYRPAYSPAYTHCFYERRRIVLRSGKAVVRRVRTCY